jgi:hypothetical protein
MTIDASWPSPEAINNALTVRGQSLFVRRIGASNHHDWIEAAHA